eukprot:6278807-Prymnesium_polylepis.1
MFPVFPRNMGNTGTRGTRPYSRVGAGYTSVRARNTPSLVTHLSHVPPCSSVFPKKQALRSAQVHGRTTLKRVRSSSGRSHHQRGDDD